jgi:hypothetical protein
MKMKLKVLNIVIGMFITACAITSCLDSDVTEYEYSSRASITRFSIVDSIVTYHQQNEELIDTIITSSVLGANYPFVINQNEGIIYNPDSLPVGTDVSKVVVDIVADTYGIYIVAENDSLWEEGDSLDFRTPVQFKVASEMGTFGRTYTAQINVHQQDPELLSWQKVENNLSTAIQEQKAIFLNGSIYIFAEQESQVALTKSTDGKSWSPLEAINIPVKADYSSVIAWENQLYIVAAQNLYSTTDGINWTKVDTEQTISQLLACTSNKHTSKLIGVDSESYYIESEDGKNWARYDKLPSDFPKAGFQFVNYPLDTNDKISRTILMGNNEEITDTTTTIWMQIDSDHDWTPLSMDVESNACPNLENAALIHYNNCLYTFGGKGQKIGKLDAFSTFFKSVDNGITWEAVTKNLFFPEEFKNLYEEAKGNYSYIIDNEQYLWIMWSQTGEVWRGRINKLGFEKQ